MSLTRLPHHRRGVVPGRALSRRRRHALRSLEPLGFHQSRMLGTDRPADHPPPLKDVGVCIASTDRELEAISALRAVSFYVYPENREFAGRRHQILKAEEEFQALKARRVQQQFRDPTSDTCIALMAVLPEDELELEVAGNDDDLRLGAGLVAVGSLDLCIARALPGEALIGEVRNAGYMASVCVATAARRRGVGQVMVRACRQLAREHGVDALYVHTMAVNEKALRFYDRCGFVVEKEETSNAAHHRGHCLDGIEGRGRTMLLRDSHLAA